MDDRRLGRLQTLLFGKDRRLALLTLIAALWSVPYFNRIATEFTQNLFRRKPREG